MKNIVFNDKEIRTVERDGLIYVNINDVKRKAVYYNINLSKSNHCTIIYAGNINKSYVLIDDLIVRLSKANIQIYKKITYEFRDVVKQFIEDETQSSQIDIPMSINPNILREATAKNYLNLALQLLNQHCNQCSIEYDTDSYPCDQCTVNPDLISHFKLNPME